MGSVLDLTFKGSILRWPSKEEIKSHIPNSFSKCPDTRVIIDCTEFFLLRSVPPLVHKRPLGVITSIITLLSYW